MKHSAPSAQPSTEELILQFARSQPELGQFSVASQLTEQGHAVSPSTVRNVWKRYGLETSYKRLMAKSKSKTTDSPRTALSQEEQSLLKRERFNRRLASEARTSEGSVTEVRREKILLAAAHAFASKGYAQASLKEICSAAGIQPASLYYHFPSKEQLFATVHHLGMQQTIEGLQRTATLYSDPWQRLEETCASALRFQLDRSALATVVRVETGTQLPAALQKKIDADRAAYEQQFRQQIDALPLHPEADRSLLRLSLLGALNWTSVWYQKGRLTPEQIGRELIRIVFGYANQRQDSAPESQTSGTTPVRA